MDKRRGEDRFINLPGFGARLYDWLTQSRPLQAQYQEIARDLSSWIDRGRLLDIGTGPGYLLTEIHQLNPELELSGLDISKAMVQQARHNLGGIPVDLQVGSIQSTDYQNEYFDLVTCSGSFYLWDHPLLGLEEIHRILKPNKAAYFYETHRDVDLKDLKSRMRDNLRGESILQRLLAPRFFLQQLRMTYDKGEIEDLLDQTRFAGSFQIADLTLVNLPAWLRIELRKGKD